MKLKKIAENHGLTPEGVDYALTQYQIVISEITHGMMSKLSYDAKDIIRTAQERWCDTCDLKEQEPVKPERVLGVLPDWYCCGACGMNMLDTGDGYRPKYCPQCGRAVKWE